MDTKETMTLDKLKAEVRKKRAMPININISELLRSALLVTCTVLLVLIHCQVQNIAHSFNSCDTDLYEDSPILERTP